MAIPTLVADLTMIDDADSNTNWSGWGQNSAKWDDEADIYIEGAGSQGLQPNVTGDGGYGYELASSINLSTNLLMIWVYTTPGFLNTAANYGVYIRICSSTTSWTTDYRDYIMGGSDVAWVGRGWHLLVLDADQSPDRTAGTTTTSNINRVGVGFAHTATASKSTVTAIDVMYYGNKVEATGATQTDSFTYNENDPSADTITRSTGDFTTHFEAGDTIVVSGTTNNNGEYTIDTVVALTITLISTDDLTQEGPVSSTIDAYIGFEDIYEKDGPTDDDWYGIITKNPLGVWEVNYTLVIGDESGSDKTRFRSRGEVVYFADQLVDVDDLLIQALQDTGDTYFELGDSTGTGDDRVGFAGSVFSQDDAYHGVGGGFDLDDPLTLSEIYGSTFLSLSGGASFSTETTNPNRVFNCTFDGCAQVDLASAEARNLVFSGYTPDADGALLWNANINIKNSRFIANRDAVNDPHAIEHSAAGTFTYTNLQFSGNDYDINFSAASGTLTINNVDGSDASTYEITGGGSSVTINTNVWIRVYVEDSDGNDIQNAQVAVYKQSDDSQLMNKDTTAAGLAEELFNYGAGPDVPIYYRVRKSSTGDTRYTPFYGTGTITTDGFTVTVILYEDPVL